jgi:hypothetical protein
MLSKGNAAHPVGCDSALKIIMIDWCTIIVSRELSPDLESLNANKNGTKLPLLSAEGCHTHLNEQHCSLITYQGVFFKGGETL